MPLVALALLAGLTLASSLTSGAPPGSPATREYAWDLVALACDEAPGGICLAYDGRIPGPTLDVNLGDTVVVHITNRLPETVPLFDPASPLAGAAPSFHVHGTSIASDADGVAAHPGTQLVESVIPPGGTFTYTFRAAFQGAWHYHDHALGADGGEGIARGLFGSLVVRPGGEARPDRVLDLHLDDRGANQGRGLDARVAPGERFEILLAGLGDPLWQVRLFDPAGVLVDEAELGPGVSDRFRVASALPGAYRWEASTGPATLAGTVEVAP